LPLKARASVKVDGSIDILDQDAAVRYLVALVHGAVLHIRYA